MTEYHEVKSFISGAGVSDLFELQEIISRKIESKRNEGKVMLFRAVDEGFAIGYATQETLKDLLHYIADHASDLCVPLRVEEYHVPESEVAEYLDRAWSL